jgi:tRNA(fMet)-specific endonuclease VapC
MLAFMLDTNICIYVMKAKPQGLRERFRSAEGRVCISTVTHAELQFGAEKSVFRERSIEAVEEFVAQVDVLSFDRNAAIHYGRLRAELQAAGTPCGLHDTQIGAHARSLGLIVVTNNRREFDRMPGLRVENWV